MAIEKITQIKAADVSADDLAALEEFVTDILDPGPLADFLTHLIASLRAGVDLVLMAGDAEALAAVFGETR